MWLQLQVEDDVQSTVSGERGDDEKNFFSFPTLKINSIPEQRMEERKTQRKGEAK